MKDASVDTNTPTISVIDNRGIQIRILEYHHIEETDPIDEYVTRSTYTLLGALEKQIDPHLFSKSQSDTRIQANMKYVTSLKGEVLRTESVDAGTKVSLFNVDEKASWLMNANGTHTTMAYLHMRRRVRKSDRSNFTNDHTVWRVWIGILPRFIYDKQTK